MMTFRIFLFISFVSLFSLMACEKKAGNTNTDIQPSTGLKVAYINGDSILMNFAQFRSESEAMEARQRKAEEDLQKQGSALEREFMNYQQQAQKGTMTGKEMEAREKYLSGKQEALLAQRDKMAKEIMDATTEINDRLQKVLHDKLNAIKERDGYDFILSYIEGGPILVADEKYDITEEVLRELNKSGDNAPSDTIEIK